jgi:uncharacterized NAD-dependent epimerase/dehydratase family protein
VSEGAYQKIAKEAIECGVECLSGFHQRLPQNLSRLRGRHDLHQVIVRLEAEDNDTCEWGKQANQSE